jgi:hypothetical protein
MTDRPELISDAYRGPLTAERRSGGGVILRTPRSYIALSASEFRALVAYADNRPHIQRYPLGAGT